MDAQQNDDALAETARRLRRLRNEAAISAEQIWREAGIAPRLLSLYEAGCYPIALEHIPSLARCLHVPVATLTEPAA